MIQKAARALMPLTWVVLSGAALAAQEKAHKPIQVSEKVTVKATIEAIDKASRSVTIKGPKGDLVTLEVDEAVKRFDQLKVGDQINAAYYESVAAEILKPGQKPQTASVSGEIRPLEGTKPGGTAKIRETMTVTVEAIDPDTPAVTVKRPDGDSVSFRVRKKKYLKNLAVGDQVVVTRVQALAITVEESK